MPRSAKCALDVEPVAVLQRALLLPILVRGSGVVWRVPETWSQIEVLASGCSIAGHTSLAQ